MRPAGMLLLLLLVLPPWVPGLAAQGTEPAPQAEPRPDKSALGNATLRCGLEPGLALPLANGLYQAPALNNGSRPLGAVLTLATWGPLPAAEAGQQTDAAAVVYLYHPGDGAWRTMLSLLQDCEGQACELACAELGGPGQRVDVQSLALRDGELQVRLVEHTPQDPPCCPTRAALRRFVLQDGNLLLKTTTAAGPGLGAQPAAQGAQAPTKP